MKQFTLFFILLLWGLSENGFAQAPPTVSGEQLICSGETTVLTAVGESGATFSWFVVPAGGSSISNNAVLTTSVLTSDTTYYVEQTTIDGTSARKTVSIVVTPTPSPDHPTNLQANPPEVCIGESSTLSGAVDAGNHQEILWYDSLTGGNLLAVTDSGETFTVTPTDTTTYYAQSGVKITESVFDFTGAIQTFTVPVGVFQIEVDAYGARGGRGNSKDALNGGRVQTMLSVSPGEVLHIYIGGKGEGYGEPNFSGSNAGGWNGGGSTSRYNVGGGGGATDIRIGGTALTDRVVVAGGSGGSGGSSCSSGHTQGGAGGGLTGQMGGGCIRSSAKPGHGGSQTGGGARGCRIVFCGSNGSLGQGGTGLNNDSGHFGAGGGGGYYGGGGGAANADGGGGSSYTDPTRCSNVIHTQDVQNGNGKLVLKYDFRASCASATRYPLTVNVNQIPVTSVSNDTSICAGNTVTLTADGADTYNWMPGNLTGSSISVNPDSSTTYTVTGTLNAGGCSSQANVTVTISQVVASEDISICEGNSTVLTATGSNTYSWEPGGLTGASVTVNPTTTTEYIVTGTEVNACTTVDTVLVTVSPKPTITASLDTMIELGANVSLTAIGADTYSWEPGGLTGERVTVSPIVDTDYIVTGTLTATTCSENDTISVKVVQPMSITGTLGVCENDPIALHVTGLDGADFAWYDALTGGTLLATTDSLSVPGLAVTTDYYVEQSLGAYTSSTRQKVNVDVTPLPNPIAPMNLLASPSDICPGDSSSLSAGVDAQNLQQAYWYDAAVDGNLLAVTDSGATFMVSPTDTTTYYVQSEVRKTIETFNFTGNVQTFTVPEGITSLTIDAYGAKGGRGNSKDALNGGRVQTSLNVTPGEVLNIYVGGRGQGYGEPNYSGSNAGGWNGGGSTFRYNVGAGGGATDIRIGGTALTDRVVVAGGSGGSGGSNCYGYGHTEGGAGGGLVGQNGGSCNFTGPTQGNGGSQTAGGARGCRHIYCGSNGSLGTGGNGTPSDGGHYGAGGGGGYYGGGGAAANADGGGGSSYTDPNRCTDVVHTQDVQDGNGKLILSFTPIRSCANEVRMPLTVNVMPQPSLVTNQTIEACADTTIELTASGADQYQWLPMNLNGDTVVITPTTNSTYTLVGSMNNGTCTDTASIQLNVFDALLTADRDTICKGDSVTLSASGAVSYLWMPGNLSGNSIALSLDTTTTYILTSTFSSGCVATDSIEIVVIDHNTLSVTPDTTVLVNTKVRLTAIGADSIVWSPGNTTGNSIEFLASDSLMYTVTGYDVRHGCQEVDSVRISIDDMPDITGTTIVLKGGSTTLNALAPTGVIGNTGEEELALFSGSSTTTFAWYDAEVGGNLLGSSSTYTTPVLDTNAVYFVEMDDGSGASLRKCIKVNIIDVESTIVDSEQDSICPSGSTNLTGEIESPGSIQWYDAPTGGNLLGTSDRGADFAVAPSATTTYYAQGETAETKDTFMFTGSSQTFVVPFGVTSICVDAYGAAGGDAITETGGRGGRVQSTMNVSPGETLLLYVGGQGESYVSGETTARAGGWNGGGIGNSSNASGGGGATDIRIGGATLLDRVLVAGGGGGGKSDACAAGAAGAGGGLTGGVGGFCSGETAAGAGTQTQGGTGGCNGGVCGIAGSFGEGGASGSSDATTAGGGGGGGWYGGGGGHDFGNGSGGSSYTNPTRTANVNLAQGIQAGNGQIILTYSLDNTTTNFDSLTIDVGDYEDPIPDVANLPTETSETTVTLTPPTATDDCAGGLVATTSDPLTYSSPGNYTVDWEYSDGNGNNFFQQQLVFITAVLPVELLNFVGTKKNNVVVLDWTTASELNSKGFSVERSIDAIQWETLGFVNSSGNSQVTRQYQYIDESPAMGTNYYRLKLVDNDNSFEYSELVQIKFESAGGGFELYPNPTSTGQFTVEITKKDFKFEQARLVVFDQLGRQVLEQTVEDKVVNLSLESMAAGTYTVKLSSGALSWQVRLIVIRN